MGKQTGIEWCDRTFNPWIGCQRVSEGCVHCYAESFAKRFNKAEWGPTAARVRTSEKYWQQPLRWNRETWRECLACGKRGRVGAGEPFYLCGCGSRDNRPTRQRVFCASLADVFEDNPQVANWRGELMKLIEATPNLDWLLLTKRPENVVNLMPAEWTEFPKNVWLGTSVENRKAFDDRMYSLARLGRRCSMIWLSIEPLLGPLGEIEEWLASVNYGEEDTRGIDWVIVGGESGAGCRPFDVAWARSIRDQCKEYDVPFFMKQLGGHPHKRDELDDLPADLRIREWPK